MLQSAKRKKHQRTLCKSVHLSVGAGREAERQSDGATERRRDGETERKEARRRETKRKKEKVRAKERRENKNRECT